MTSVAQLAEKIQAGDKRAIARGLTWVEKATPEGRELVRSIFAKGGQAHVIGITGAPGVGKSTLVNALTLTLRARGHRVGILAVDPSSPFSGGAILGDRIRMQESVMDPSVFMRSLASRGHLGGLSRATFGALAVLDAAGFDKILIETVGAGQSEVEIMQLAHTTLVVLAPGLGDDIQAIKAGILEIGQIFVVNKADRDGADHTVRQLKTMLTLGSETLDWVPPIVKTVAEKSEGIGEVADAIEQHRTFLFQRGLFQDRRLVQTEHMIEQSLADEVARRLADARQRPVWRQWIEAVSHGELDASQVALAIIETREEDSDGLKHLK